MRIRFLANTNIRISPTDLSKPPIGVVFSGVELEVEDRLYKGKAVEGVDTYFRDNHGWFYWSGRVVILYKALEGPKVRKRETAPEGEYIGGSWELRLGRQEEEPDAGPAGEEPQPAPGPLQAEARLPQKETTPERQASPAQEVLGNLDSMPLNWGHKALDIPGFFWKERKLVGKGIKVAILGTGVQTGHPDLLGKVVKGRNFSGGSDADFQDENGEGTAFALLVGGTGREKMAGAAPAAQLLVGKVMANYLDIHVGQFIGAFQWAVEEGVDIIMSNIEFKESLLDRRQRNQLSELYEKAVQRGIFCIAPAGRSKNVRPENRYPAALSTCLSVGAYEENGERSPNSIRSYALDVIAPGGGLAKGPGPAGQEAVGSAAAFTAGSVALLMEWLHNNKRAIGVRELMKVIRETATPKYPNIKCRDIEYGCGYFNPAKVLERLEMAATT